TALARWPPRSPPANCWATTRWRPSATGCATTSAIFPAAATCPSPPSRSTAAALGCAGICPTWGLPCVAACAFPPALWWAISTASSPWTCTPGSRPMWGDAGIPSTPPRANSGAAMWPSAMAAMPPMSPSTTSLAPRYPPSPSTYRSSCLTRDDLGPAGPAPGQPPAAPVATPTAAELRRTGRHPRVPFAIPLGEDTRITVTRVLRVLPGKRIVGEGELNGQQVLVKLFIAKTGFRHLRRELAGIQALKRGALPTPGLHPARPAGTPAGHLLLTEFLAGSEPLDVAPGDDPDRQLQRFELAFALLGRLPRAGPTHSRLHPGNLLRHKDTLYILDGDAVKPPPRGRALDTGKAIDNLATLLEM